MYNESHIQILKVHFAFHVLSMKYLSSGCEKKNSEVLEKYSSVIIIINL